MPIAPEELYATGSGAPARRLIDVRAPVEVARESRRALEERLLILQVPTAFLDASEAPEETLRRPDLFATPEQAAS